MTKKLKPDPRGGTIEDLLALSGTMTAENAEEMLRIIEEGCEQIEWSVDDDPLL